MGWSELQAKCKNRLVVFSSNARSRKIRKNIPCLAPAQQSTAVNRVWDEKKDALDERTVTAPISSTVEPSWSNNQIPGAEMNTQEIQHPLRRVDSWSSRAESTKSRQKRKSAQFESEEYDEYSDFQKAKFLKRRSAPLDRTKTTEMLERRIHRRGKSFEQISRALQNPGGECFPSYTIPETNEMPEMEYDAYQCTPMSSMLDLNRSEVEWLATTSPEIFDEPLLMEPTEPIDISRDLVAMNKSFNQGYDTPKSPVESTFNYQLGDSARRSCLSELHEQDRQLTRNSSASEAFLSEQYTLQNDQQLWTPDINGDICAKSYCLECSCGLCPDDEYRCLELPQAWHIDNFCSLCTDDQDPKHKISCSGLFYDLNPKLTDTHDRPLPLEEPMPTESWPDKIGDLAYFDFDPETPFQAWRVKSPRSLHNHPLQLRKKKSIPLEPLFPCTLCNKYSGKKAFKRKDHLDQHLRYSHGIENLVPIYCPHKCCSLSLLHCTRNKAFESSKDFHEHLRTVHAESMWNCPISDCGRRGKKGYSGKANLVNHLREKHGLVWNEDKLIKHGPADEIDGKKDANMI